MNEIQITHDDAAETVYAIVRNQAGQFYAGAAAETFEAANWATYAITLAVVDTTSPPATGNVAIQGTFPAVAAGFYWLDMFIRAGAAAAQTDYRLERRLVWWTGAAVLLGAGAADVRALAGGKYTIAATTGDWATAGTWASGIVPVAGDNIIVRNGVTVTVAADLNLGQFGTQEVQGSGALNIAEGVTVALVPAGWAIATNYGTATNNRGIVASNEGVVQYNYGTVAINAGTVVSNVGTVRWSTSEVTANSGTLVTNTGTVTNNYDIMTKNTGTVTTNKSGGLVFNALGGVVTTNNSGGLVRDNIGTVTTNNSGGLVFNALGGVVTTNNGSVYSTQISAAAALAAYPVATPANVLDAAGAAVLAAIDGVLDENLGPHNVANSLGKIVRNLPVTVAIGEAQGGTANTVILEAGSSAINDFYFPGMILLDHGTDVKQVRRIESYDGDTLTVTVATPWTITPVAGVEYQILPWASVRVSEIDDAAIAPLATAAALATVDTVVDAIQLKTDTIGSGRVTYASTVGEAALATIWAGDDRAAADGTQFSITVEDYAGPSLAAATAVLRIMDSVQYLSEDPAEPRAADLEVAATIAIDGTTITLTADLTAAQTAAFDTSPPATARNYIYEFVCTLANTRVGYRTHGQMTVRKGIE